MLKNYFEFTAKNNFELGLQMGLAFRRQSRKRFARQKKSKNWTKRVTLAQKFLVPTKKHFPHLIEELEGYALGAKIGFLELWAASLEDDLDAGRCTTIITNRGRLIGHSEDFAGAKNDIALVKKTIGSLTILEIFYFNTLGGNAVGVNSHGVIHVTNSLYPTDNTLGIPKNVIARWLSETKNPTANFGELHSLPRASGYNYNFINLRGEITNIETTARRALLTRVTAPFCHTNHYLTALKKYEGYNKTSSFRRYEKAAELIRPAMKIAEIQTVLADTSKGKTNSIRNKETVGNIIFNIDEPAMHVWLLVENARGFTKFKLDFIKE